ncbi:MAG: hypothetical protein Q4D38_02860 [Planctomycetia bacterium]|nr:hypothetical protein [Planctomycetia bacterium]
MAICKYFDWLGIVALLFVCCCTCADDAWAQRWADRGARAEGRAGIFSAGRAAQEERLQRRLMTPEQRNFYRTLSPEERENYRLNAMERSDSRPRPDLRLFRPRPEGGLDEGARVSDSATPPTAVRRPLRPRNPNVPTPAAPFVRPDQQYSNPNEVASPRVVPTERVLSADEKPIRDMTSEEISELLGDAQ